MSKKINYWRVHSQTQILKEARREPKIWLSDISDIMNASSLLLTINCYQKINPHADAQKWKLLLATLLSSGPD
jgi:hypothetical protein